MSGACRRPGRRRPPFALRPPAVGLGPARAETGRGVDEVAITEGVGPRPRLRSASRGGAARLRLRAIAIVVGLLFRCWLLRWAVKPFASGCHHRSTRAWSIEAQVQFAARWIGCS